MKTIKRIVAVTLLLCFVCILVFTGVSAQNSRNTRSIVLYYDSTLPNGIVANLWTMTSSATNAFNTTFGLSFSIQSSSQSNLLNGSACPRPNNQECILLANGCGASCNGVHHKSAERLLGRVPNLGTTHSLGFVGHYLCAQTGAGHIKAGGAAFTSTRRALVTNEWHESLSFLIQHELSHNLGALDHAGNARCVLRSNATFMSEWCATCSATIRRNI
ncbi:MAG: hypothetical protein LBC71_06250 [Oscillospiraceae bacterium]|jgi:hypothetical protein|nr:hypothetical protein [Oscillospiraceae bacterium]